MKIFSISILVICSAYLLITYGMFFVDNLSAASAGIDDNREFVSDRLSSDHSSKMHKRLNNDRKETKHLAVGDTGSAWNRTT